MEPPAEYLCPISGDLMQDPVMLVETGQVYERVSIEQWFARGHQTDPLTNLVLSDRRLTPVLALRSLIEQFIRQQTERQRLGIDNMDVSIPSIAQERLNLGNVIHRGLMANVLEAELLPLGQQVVVKMFPILAGLTGAETAHFRKEVQFSYQASLFCHNVCRLIGVASINGQPAMVMPRYVASLEQVLREQQQQPAQAGTNNGAAAAPAGLPLDRLLSIGRDIALAVADLHKRGIMVLDLKSANILLDRYGRAVVADFGISALRTNTMSRYMPTSGGAHGTPNYMAPEQWMPDTFGGISLAADAWGFGCILVEMASGTPPWAGLNMFQVVAIITVQKKSPPIPASLPGVLADLARRCFAFEPAERPTFAEILAVLRQRMDGQAAARAPAVVTAREPAVDTAALLELLRDVNVADEYGRTPLLRAAKAGHLDTVQQLIAGGADINAKDKVCCTRARIRSRDGHQLGKSSACVHYATFL
eukprot:jgi/Mesvir1/5913/Mv00682-RA.1